MTMWPRVLGVLLVGAIASNGSARPAGDALDDSSKAPWDVSSPPGEWADVVVDTDEGTWINLDLSPDGSMIVFDLLGDLYTLPITGGEARAVTSGIAWDMQPKWSPDGRRIAFTSDRAPSNGDNIWTIRPDGSDPRQVTKESFRLCNSPAWMPPSSAIGDSPFIVAQKHFSSHRSLGAGEMWLYPTSGTFDGLQLTTKPTDQKNVGEPAFSPDGRYLYYSLDATPGNDFEYNKDSNKQIYCIDRLDRVKGETVRVVDGPGGACRPTPSPDGKSLAFVRRIREKTALFIMDLASSRIRPVYDRLDRDMQETWAIHGVYPSFAWTPDSKHLVFWAGGKIRTIAADAEFEPGSEAQAKIIPFHVRTTRAVTKSLRFPIAAAPETFDTKMIRWARVSPRGDHVVFQTLGKLYLRTLRTDADGRLIAGEPGRLCAEADRFENCPSWSRDGTKMVFTTWNDATLAEVRTIDLATRAETVVTDAPGHYVDPVFTPDGEKIVFGKVSGGFLTDPAWSLEPGVYWTPAAGGKAQRITTKGTHPQFADASDRVYLTVITHEKDTDKSSLISINLDGGEERPHVSTENATEFAVSPDGRWVMFVERFQMFVAPLIVTGRDVTLGTKSTSVPVAKVSNESGNYIGFTGDSRGVYWSLGPTLHQCSIADALATVRGPEKRSSEETPSDDDPKPGRAAAPPPSVEVAIGFAHPSFAPDGVIAFVHARALTMRGDEIIGDATVIVERNRIIAVGPSASMPVPDSAFVIDCTGKTLMPGLIDVHAHGPMGTEGGIMPQRNWGQYANLAFGVTTIHDPSNDTASIFAASELQRAGLMIAPRIFSTGTILYGAAGSIKAEVESFDDAMFHLKRMQAVGAFSVKSYNQPRRDQRQMIIEAARQLGMMVVPEGGSLLQHNLTMVVDGHTGVEHTVPVAKVYNDVTQIWGATEVGYTPTLIVGYGGLVGEQYWYEHEDVWKNERLRNFVPAFVVQPRAVRRQKSPLEDYNHFAEARVAHELAGVGVKVNLGAHGQLAGLGAHWELQMLGQGGMAPMAALRAATINGAHYIGLDADLGTIEAGKLADLIVLDADPSQDLANIGSIKFVMANGRLFDAMTMNEVGEHSHTREPWYFEKANAAGGIQTWSHTCGGCGIAGAGCTSEPVDKSGYR